METETHYRKALDKEYARRCAKNPRYSMRAFARDLGISASGLSQLMGGKQGLSKASATSIARKLGLSPAQAKLFCDSVESLHARSRRARLKAKTRLQSKLPAHQISLDAFEAISQWHHLAILELTTLSNFKSDTAWIARSLGVPHSKAAQAIERLIRLGLLELRDEQLRQTVGYAATPSEIPSPAIKSFHLQIMEKAKTALLRQQVDQRDFSSVVVPINRSDLPAAKEFIRKLRRKLVAQLESSPQKDAVFCFSTQFFSLSRTTPENEC